jgi:hypothetical protein
MVAAIIMILAHGPLTLDIIGKRVSLYPPGHLTTAAWAVLCLRAAIAWARYPTVLDAKIGVAGRELLYWHVVPIAVWFLIPHALSNFLWYVGPTHHGSSNGYHPLLALHDQWVGFSRGFHVAPWAAILAVGLSAMAVAQMRALTAGARPVVILAILSAAAVVLHPQQQLRFQTTWLFAVWVLAGAGSAIVLAWLTSRWPSFMRFIVAGTAVGALAAAEAHQTLSPLIYQASIRSRSGVSDLAFSDAYLPHLADTRNVGFVATFGRTGFFQWTVRERCRCLAVIDMPWLPQIGSREEALAIGAVWLAATSANRIVVVDAPDYESDPRQRYDHLIGLVDAMESQSRFRKVASEVLAPFHATITIWQRR